MIPSLAGQDRSYLVGQLEAFRERRRHAAMEGIIIKLTDGDIAYMATHYAKQAPMAERAFRGWPVSKRFISRGHCLPTGRASGRRPEWMRR